MEVANVVASIISAFGNGMDLFRRMAGKKPKRRGREPTLSEEEAWLRDSLYHRPLDIQRSYHQHVSRHGHRYEIGDSIAHTSLAHTLLTLNSGLIKLINRALSKDSKKDDSLARRSLLSLSELAASDTLNALSQLSLRLKSQSQLALVPPPRRAEGQRKESDLKTGRERQNQKVSEMEKPAIRQELKLKGGGGKAAPKKRPGPAPLLVRGGWVRAKSSSVVSASSSKSGSNKTVTSKHQRSKSEPLVTNFTRKRLSNNLQKGSQATLESTINTEPPMSRQRSQLDLSRPQRQPSMLIVSSDIFPPQAEPELEDYQPAPPRPPKIPLHSRPHPNLRPRPKSSGTTRSASTKIGEIPDRYSQTLRPVGEQAYDPRLVEYLMSTPNGAPPEQPKKRGRGFRFWKKEENRQPVPTF